MAELLFFLFLHMTNAERKYQWKNKEYSTMQNIIRVVGPTNYTNYFIYEGTFYQDILIKKSVSCLIMRTREYYGEIIAYRKYKNQEDPKQLNELSLYLSPQKDPGYSVDNYMQVEDADEFQDLGNMHLVYTDYTNCALFYYDETEDYELWLYKKPDGLATDCELLLALLSDKPRNVLYTNDCSS